MNRNINLLLCASLITCLSAYGVDGEHETLSAEQLALQQHNLELALRGLAKSPPIIPALHTIDGKFILLETSLEDVIVQDLFTMSSVRIDGLIRPYDKENYHHNIKVIGGMVGSAGLHLTYLFGLYILPVDLYKENMKTDFESVKKTAVEIVTALYLEDDNNWPLDDVAHKEFFREAMKQYWVSYETKNIETKAIT